MLKGIDTQRYFSIFYSQSMHIQRFFNQFLLHNKKKRKMKTNQVNNIFETLVKLVIILIWSESKVHKIWILNVTLLQYFICSTKVTKFDFWGVSYDFLCLFSFFSPTQTCFYIYVRFYLSFSSVLIHCSYYKG